MSDFARRLNIAQIREGATLDLEADKAERQAVAERLRLPALEQFEAQATLARYGEMVRVHGRIRAALSQSCVATGEPVPAEVDEPFELLFCPEPAVGADEEVELSEEDCDVVFHDGATIDLGSALADTLALALDPYPRSPRANDALREAGVLSEEQASPFAVLAGLKHKT